jgi:hypothetical protein
MDMMTRRNNGLVTAVQICLLAWSGTTLAADQVYVANGVLTRSACSMRHR